MKWAIGMTPAETEQALDALRTLDALGFFNALSHELSTDLVRGLAGLSDIDALDRIKSMRAQIEILERLKSEAALPASPSDSDN